jgi:nucleobase:cation symporter-1, NCS1 family
MSAAHDTQFGVVERRGIELVPESERHGKPRDLFFVWVAANANVFSIVNGALLISLGLNF